MEIEKALSATVCGRVQGVGFRFSAKEEAERLGLSGWVRNTGSGAVEVWAEGPEESLNVFSGWLKRGPSWARVDEVREQWLQPLKTYKRFTIQ